MISVSENGVIRLEIPEYINKIQMSKAQKPKFILQSRANLPKKYLTASYYFHNGVLHDATTGYPVVANSRSVGTPLMKPINGQAFYSGFASPHQRITMVNGIKDFLRVHVADLPMLPYPIRVDIELYELPGRANWDLDNLWIYAKCFQDLLTESSYIVGTGKREVEVQVTPKLPDDCIRYITKSPGIEYFPVDTPEDRKLVFVLSPEHRLEILSHPLYKLTP